MPFPSDKNDAPKHDAPKAATPATPAAAAAHAAKADDAKPKKVEDVIKDAKAAAAKAPDGDLKDEAQRGVEAAEALLADGQQGRAMAAARQVLSLLPKAPK